MTDERPLDTTERKVRSILLGGVARAHGFNPDRSCAECGEGEAEHDDDGRCPFGDNYYRRRDDR